ncbi:MAG TPA: high frequency lysogenization protein HflD [Pararobbsia sp.]|nr:high frequency lysogenization protein HflD [Pararobbsia sp.]
MAASSSVAAPAIDVFGRPVAVAPADTVHASASAGATPPASPASNAESANSGASNVQGAINVFGVPNSAETHDSADASPAPAHTIHWPEPVRVVLATGIEWQGELNARIEDAASELQNASSPRVWLTLLLMSFIYGVLHAVGPGHGKFVVGTWLSSRRARVAQALLLSGWTAGVQAMSAIVLVIGAAWLSATGLSSVLSRAESLEIVSYALLCVAGLWALWGAITNADCCFDPAAVRLVPSRRDLAKRSGWRARNASRVSQGQNDRDSDSADDGEESGAEGRTAYLGAKLSYLRRDTAPSVALNLAGVASPSSRFARVPGSQPGWLTRMRASTPGQILATGIAAGVRPCVGAIFVLVASVAAHVPWVGIASTFAMAAGVAITVTVVGLSGVGANRLIAKSSLHHQRRLQTLQRALAISGAVVIILFAGMQIALLLTGTIAPSLT